MSPSMKQFLRESAETVIIALVLALLIRGFLVESFLVQGYSMEPTLHDGERLLVNKLAYRLEAPERGDIVVFRYPLNPKRDFIKRVVGTPGDTIEIRHNQVFLNGQPLKEDYILPDRYPRNYQPVTVRPGTVYVLGDNRGNSEDSRIFGVVPIENIKGRAFLVYWPVSELEVIR